MLSFQRVGNDQLFKPTIALLRALEQYQNGQYSTAKSNCKQIAKRYSFFPKSHFLIFDLNELAQSSSENEGKFIESEKILDSLCYYSKISYGKNSTKFVIYNLQKANFCAKFNGSINNSISVYKTFFEDKIEKQYSNSAILKLNFLEYYTQLLQMSDNYIKALVFAKQGLYISEKNFGINSSESQYFKSLVSLHQFNNGVYNEFVNSLNASVEMKIQDEDPNYMLKSIYLQSDLFRWIGEFSKMEKLLLKANQISLLSEEKKFYERFKTLEELASLFIINGNYYKAEKNLRFSIEKKLNVANNTSFILLEPSIKSIELKLQKGELSEADKYLGYLEKMINMYYTRKSSTNCQFLLLKSEYCKSISDFSRAIKYQNEAIEIMISVFGDSHVRLVSLYTNLGDLILKENSSNLDLANTKYELAKNIILKAFGNNSPSYANLLQKQALVFIDLDELSKAQENLSLAEKFWNEKIGGDNIYVAEIKHIRGKLFYKKMMLNEANDNFQKSSHIFLSLFSNKHPSYLSTIVDQSKVAFMQKDFENAAKLLKPVLEKRLEFTKNNFSIMTFSQKNTFWSTFKEEFELYNSILFQLNERSVKGKLFNNKEMYNYAIKTKGLLLSTDANIRRSIYSSNDTSLVSLYQEWLFQKEYYALISTFSKSQLEEERISPDDIQLNIENLEKNINAQTNIKINNNEKIEWENLKSSLSKGTSAVEMVRFRKFNHVFTDTVFYVALITNYEDIDGPLAVYFLDGKSLEKQNLKYYRNTSIGKVVDEISYNAFWEPIKLKIEDGNTIFFSSEGVFNQINPEMLYNPQTNKFAIENNSFVFVSNTKDIIGNSSENKKVKNSQDFFALYGNPKFYQISGQSRKDTVPSLAGAEKEISDIDSLFKKYSKSTIKLIGSEVTEDTLRKIENPTIMHIATHGYFVDIKKDNNLTQNPMLNSALMLSGSGDIISNLEGSYINQNLGMLTASEVMEMDFANTNLVVLSACETGRGQVEVGEGVYGLQRAFLVAGARAIVLSLFKVDDEATRLLMLKFYEKFLENGGDYRKAFTESKKELKNIPEYNNPLFWGAFIMVEGKFDSKQF